MFQSQDESELLESSGISHHKKLCIQLRRAEQKVLQNALKFASTSRNESAERLESGKKCDTESNRGNSSDNVDEMRLTNMNTSGAMDETASNVSQLCIDGE